MEKFYTFIFTLIWVKLAVNGTSTPNPRKPIFTSTPDESNLVLVGKNIKLEWNFKFRSASDIRRIVLFSYGLRSKAKTTIASRVIKSGIFQYNPHIPERQKLFVCEISLKEDGIGKASISILNVQFDHTYDYGISVKMTDLAPAENVVSLKVVDMIRGDKSKDSKIIRSWIGQKLILKCDVKHGNNIRPLFKWYRRSGNTVENLFAPNNTRIMIIKKVNTTHFGEYTCEARTRMVTVSQKFRVGKLGYAGSPQKLDYRYFPKTKSYALYWEQPSTRDGHRVRKYILEEWNAEKKMWVIRHNITSLLVTVNKLQSTTKYRVCSENEIGYKETSCSKPIELPKTMVVTSDKRGKSSQFWPSIFLISLMTFLASVLPRHQ